MVVGWTVLQGLAVAAVLYVAYAYLLRFERLALGRLALRGDVRWGIVWPLIVALRALLKPVALPSGWRRLTTVAGPLLSAGALLAACLLLCRGSLSGGLILIALAPAGVLLGAAGSWGQDGWRRASRTVTWSWAYVLPALLGLGAVFILAGSADLAAVQSGQHASLPYLVYQPVGALVVGLAAVLGSRHLTVAVPKPGAALLLDFHLQYAGWTQALYHWANYLHIMAAATLMVLIYLGGSWGPGSEGIHWLALKSLMVTTALLWLRHVWAGPREAQLGRRLWVLLVAVGAGNVLLTALLRWPFD
ncbi:MAG: NADH-quinone oxidoreductase subunit H [Anaerolineae bacterium]